MFTMYRDSLYMANPSTNCHDKYTLGSNQDNVFRLNMAYLKYGHTVVRDYFSILQNMSLISIDLLRLYCGKPTLSINRCIISLSELCSIDEHGEMNQSITVACYRLPLFVWCPCFCWVNYQVFNIHIGVWAIMDLKLQLLMMLCLNFHQTKVTSIA